jgi:ribosome-associated protein
METFNLKGDYIELDKLLKVTGIAESGGMAHAMSDDGDVLVNGVVETRRRAKIRPGQEIQVGGRTIRVVNSPTL